ncbi:MAG TPA: TonB-dependent receptor [Vicinamibacterales bacterium]
MTIRFPLRLVIVAIAATQLTLSLSAQTPFSSSIAGTVRDSTGAVIANATISIAGPALIGGTKTTPSGAEGAYRFLQLPSGEYEVSVDAPGFRPLKHVGVRVESGATLTLDHQLEVAGVADTMVIRGEAPAVDVRNPGVPVRLDDDLLTNMPTPRWIASLINLAPGVSSDVAFGGSQAGNEILIDGVRMTGPMLQDPGLRANYNWVKEVNVVALGAPAEYGGFTGAAAFATLRSGSNRFSGLGEFWTTQPSWLSSNTDGLSESLQRQFASREIVNWYDSSAQLGGPVMRDRLWFFAGVQLARHNDKPAGFSGPGSRDERDRQFIVKPTASLSPGVRLEGFIEHGTDRVTGDALGPEFPIESTNDNWAPQTTWNVNAAWTLSGRTFAEARYGGYDNRWWSDPHPPGTIDGPYPHYDELFGTWSQNTNYYLRDDSSIHTVAGLVTHHVDGGLGVSHDLKAGLEYEATFARQQLRYPGGRNYYDLLGAPSEVEVWAGYKGEATTGRNVAYLQDTWFVTDRLTITPGVRFEWNRGSVPNQKNVFRTQTVSPRFGLAWDVTGDHRTVARLHYGRYYDPIFSGRIAQEDRSEVNQSIYYRIDGPDQWVELSRTSTQDTFEIDPELEHSHVDQLILGVEREVVSDVSLQAQYIRRRFDTFMGLIDVGSIYAPIRLRDPGPDGRLNTTDDGALLDVFNLTNPGNVHTVYTNPDGAYNDYDAVQLVGRKRYSRDWQLQASYTWSRNRGTVGNRWHVNAARFDLGQPGRFVNPNLFINADGRASFDPTHEAKLLGSYRIAPWGGFMVSGVYRYTTGQAWSRTAVVTGFAQGTQRIRIEPQGAERLPAINRLDFRVEKTVPFEGPTLGLFVDVFNLWNQGVPDSDITEAVVSNSGPRFGQPNAWVDPRMLRLGVRVSF